MENKGFVKVKLETKSRLNELAKEKGLSINTLINILIKDSSENEDEIRKLAEENRILKQREDEIFHVADDVSDGIYLADRDGIVISVNNSYTKITGILQHEVVGKNMQAVLNEKYLSNEYFMLQDENLNEFNDSTKGNIDKPQITEKPFAICRMVLEQKKKISIIGAIETKKTRKTVLFIGKPYFDENSNVTHVLVVMRDIEGFAQVKKRLFEVEKRSKKYLDELIYLRNNQFSDNLIAKDSSMGNVLEMINHVAKTDATVLITGETGVGKEVVAGEIYKKSNRNKQPYIKVNCAAIPESLLESEMFGYERGSFTGADKKEKLGYFEIAHGGTLLLDEIGEMPLKLQSKLLRVLQEKEITRIGSTKSIKIDVRIIAVTNQNVEEQIKMGTFREDLYYRLNVIPIEIPPLRKRKSDIALLAYKFLNKFTEKYNKHKEFHVSAMKALENYKWPGNVRELENLVERLVIIGEETLIEEEDVINILGSNKFEYSINYREDITLKEATDIIEKNIIEKTLRKYKSSRKAAKVLGVTQPTILRKAKALGIIEW